MIIIFSPLIIAVLLFASPILLGDYLYSRYRKEPKPQIPETVNADGASGKEMATKCLDFIANRLAGIEYKVEELENSYRLVPSSPNGKIVTLSFDTVFDIEIADLNTYEWYLNENYLETDLHLWIVVGVLRGGVQKARSRLGRVTYWVWCEELGVWVVVQKEGTSYDGIHFYDNPPEHIKAQFSVL